MSFITGALGFILGLGIIITIHELGHYYVARLANVKILSFSIGFGKPIYQWVRGRDQTRYIIGAIPLGGYVSMMGATEKYIEEGHESRAFCNQPLWVRSLIVVAGPAANFLLAIILISATYVIGSQEIKPVIGSVAESSIAMSAGLRKDDRIIAVNNTEVTKWTNASLLIVQGILDSNPVNLRVLRDEQPTELTLNASTDILEGEESILDTLGITPFIFQLSPVIGKIIASSSAEKAGLQEQDKILAFNQTPVKSWQALVDQIVSHPGATVNLQIQRNSTVINLPITLASINQRDRRIGRAGIAPYVDRELMREHTQFVSYGLFTALAKGTLETVRMTQLTLTFLWRMISGEMSLKNISGPVTIAEVTGTSFNIGLIAYLITLSLISISIGILNLLPIPMLDGGHLFYYAVEFIKRSPVSETTQLIGQRIGIGLLAVLMMIAFYNDLTRLFVN